MEPLQKQVSILSNKVDTLYQVVDRLNSQVSSALTECRLTPASAPTDVMGEANGRYGNNSYSASKLVMEHKDVLLDSNELDTHLHSGEKELAPEIQIQRLTAQLTAAYNRIAALEEQLLARRIH
ncbi:hypothetical protein H6G17_15600 [Chroococcidiopsis sp. FACHB-1243]|uniref:hypothetical protein n=1 Tax=Chroococcidiopsis sp. [FACHB-1243] TaxID=2692781 RepID=UPI00177B9F73|nr:hypothetical protein [Chroococcidiopsis sp. [FACHB-1243]]MBD2306925.1 hypothetical protein [Chroococcidiopsis sp. [FACHB-1243]]